MTAMVLWCGCGTFLTGPHGKTLSHWLIDCRKSGKILGYSRWNKWVAGGHGPWGLYMVLLPPCSFSVCQLKRNSPEALDAATTSHSCPWCHHHGKLNPLQTKSPIKPRIVSVGLADGEPGDWATGKMHLTMACLYDLWHFSALFVTSS